MGLSRLDRYIGRHVLVSTLLVFLVLFLLMGFIHFVDGLSDIGKANYGLLDLFRYVLLSLPKRLYDLFPTIALLGSVVGLSMLASNAELIAMRAAGLSVWRIAGSVMKTAMVFVVLGLAMGEWVVPVAEDAAQQGRAQALKTVFRSESGIWMREQNAFVNIGEVMPDQSLRNISIYHFNEDWSLPGITSARHAHYRNKQWRLKNVRESVISKQGVTLKTTDNQVWQTRLEPESLAAFAVNPATLPLMQLLRYIDHLEQNQQRTDPYDLAMWGKVLTPVATAVMMLLALPFVFAQPRGGRLGGHVFIGILVALAFNLLNLTFGYVSLLYHLPPVLGAMLPTVIFLLVATGLLRRAA